MCLNHGTAVHIINSVRDCIASMRSIAYNQADKYTHLRCDYIRHTKCGDDMQPCWADDIPLLSQRIKIRQSEDCLILVPVAGVEPARYRYQRILSPPRLPIPTHRRAYQLQELYNISVILSRERIINIRKSLF